MAPHMPSVKKQPNKVSRIAVVNFHIDQITVIDIKDVYFFFSYKIEDYILKQIEQTKSQKPWQNYPKCKM